MYKESDFVKEVYTTGDVAKYLGISPRTVMRKDREGTISFKRSDTNRRILPREDLLEYLDKTGLLYRDGDNRFDVIYARVSTGKQKERGDLDRQVVNVLDYAKEMGLTRLKILKEVGSGLNDNRKELARLLGYIMERRVSRVFVNYRDRLTRFGFRYIEAVCKYNGTEIIVISDETREKTVQEELAEDLVAIIHSFSGKLYGLRRSAKKDIEQRINSLPEAGNE
jgi:putative resolvase